MIGSTNLQNLVWQEKRRRLAPTLFSNIMFYRRRQGLSVAIELGCRNTNLHTKECGVWFYLLAEKWKTKTPDPEEQVTQITERLIEQVRIDPELSNIHTTFWFVDPPVI